MVNYNNGKMNRSNQILVRKMAIFILVPRQTVIDLGCPVDLK